MFRSMLASAGARTAILPVTAIASAVTTYLIVGYAGAEMFGAINVIATLFLLLPFADLGLGAAIVNKVSSAASGDAMESARALTRAAFFTLIISGSGLIAVVGIAAALGALAPALGLDDVGVAHANVAVLVAVAPFAVSLPFGVGQRVLLGLGKNHLLTLYSATAPIATVLLTWLLVEAEVPPLFLASASSFGVLVSAVVAFVVALRVSGWARKFFRRPSLPNSPTELWSAAAPMLVITIAVAFGQQSGRLIVANFATAADLAQYAVAFQFYLPALSVAATAGAALWPIFARSRGNNRKPLLRALAIMFGLGAVLALGYGLLIAPVGSLVTHGEVTVAPLLAWLLATQLLMMSLHQAAATLLTTPGMLAFQAVCAVVMAGISIGLGVLLTPMYGAPGVALAAIAALVFGQVIPGIIAAWRVAGRA